MTRIAGCAVAVVLALAPAGARGDEPVSEQFRRAVAAKGAAYVAARDALVGRAGEARPILEAAARSADWRERVTAAAVLGWIDHAALYAELAAWSPSPRATRLRNPIPASKAEARERLAAAGDPAVPFMLERVWKLDDHMWGGADARLVELRVPDALPVLGEALLTTASYNSLDEIAGFGAAATPYLLAALEKTDGQRREILLYALGETGDPAAEPALRRELRAGASEDARQVAAAGLGRLGAFAALRAELPALAGEELRRAALRALGGDPSAEGRAFLLDVAASSRLASDRGDAVASLLAKATPEELAAVCALLPREPRAEVRAEIVGLLETHGDDDPGVAAALLAALDDRALVVRDAAAYALRYNDAPAVAGRLLAMLRSTSAESARLALIAAESTCGRAFGEAAVRWLDDPRTRDLALDQLRQNPTPAATEPVVRLLSSPSEDVRFRAAVTLGYSGDPRARAALEAAAARERAPEVLRIIRESLRDWPERSLCTTLEQADPDGPK